MVTPPFIALVPSPRPRKPHPGMIAEAALEGMGLVAARETVSQPVLPVATRDQGRFPTQIAETIECVGRTLFETRCRQATGGETHLSFAIFTRQQRQPYPDAATDSG
jgi:hypothetical protein